MPNHLSQENSPYLLQHAENPVEWYPWGKEALQRAQEEDKPIFLSIGYAACHWCHVIAHESFEDDHTAAIMNQHFINIKVDREERPDLDGIYMQVVVAMSGRGGWPMSVFLTPEGIPILGSTYFPPTQRYNMPAFRDVLLAVAHAWQNDRPNTLENGKKLVKILQHIESTSQPTTSLSPESLNQATLALAKSYDWKQGGWGNAPKFPQPMTIEFLLRRAVGKNDKMAQDIALHALKSMARGGMYDVIGGGFARYSTDNNWLVPHFEKMLYDNAQLARAYLHGYLISKEEHLRQVCEETLDFIMREMTHPQGGFYASLDADSEGEEGKFYTWSEEELRQILKDPLDFELFTQAYPISKKGNFEGRNILQRLYGDAELAERLSRPVEEVRAHLETIQARLLKTRSTRVRPATDDKVLTSWNALMLTAFAEAARYLRPKHIAGDNETTQKTKCYLRVAIRNADFLLTHLHPEDRLLRSWRKGQARHNAFLEDYAALILALLSLYQSDPNQRWYRQAVRLADEMIAHFADSSEAGVFFDTRDDHGALIIRPKERQDNAIPSGNAMAVLALLQLATYGENSHQYRTMAEKSLSTILPTAQRYPGNLSFWLCAGDYALHQVQEVVIAGDPNTADRQALIDVLWGTYRPHLIAAITNGEISADAPPLAAERPFINGQATAYVCQNFTCQQPIFDPDRLEKQLTGET